MSKQNRTIVFYINNSQGSLTMHLRCGEIFDHHSVADLRLTVVTIKDFLE